MGRGNETWLARLRGDESEQQAALRELRGALLRGLIRAFSGNTRANEAFLEDAAQDSLIRILDRLSQFEGRSRFVTWATSIAIHTAMSELRRRRWQDVSLDEVVAGRASLEPREATDKGTEPTAAAQRREIVETMYEIIRHRLTDRQRIALLAELKGMPQVEIARRLGSNRNAVYKLTHDARKRLKRGLEAAGFHAEDIHAAFEP